MITIKNLNLKNTAILRNAFQVSYEKPVNQIWSAGFSLPLNDPAVKKVRQLQYAEIKDKDGEYIGLFRVGPKVTDISDSGRIVKYSCTHVLSTLIDSSIEGYRQTQRGWSTRQVIEWILSFQDVKHWKLGRCDFDRKFEYNFENINGLASPLFSITEPFAEDFMWTWDTTSYPWTINLIKPETKPTCRIREGWNLKSLSVEENPNKIINRLIAIGKGDGINNLNFKRINNGKNYIEDLESQALYGLIEYIWKDERFASEETLLASAQAMLEKFKRPIVTWKIKAVDLIKSIPARSTIRIPKIDELRAGQVVQLWTALFGVINLRIVNEKKSDLYGDPGNIDLEIGYIGEDVATTIADLERKLEIYKLSSVGATNKDTIPMTDNCDPEHPLPIDFYVEEELKRVNKILLTYKIEKFRAYSRAIKGGGAVVKSTGGGGAIVKATGGGGAIVKSTEGGGGVVKATGGGGSIVKGGTSETAGQSTQTSSANGYHNHTALLYGGDYTGGWGETDRYYWGLGQGNAIILKTTSPNDIVTAGAADNHSHNVTTPAHSHNFSFSLPNHTHEINLPNHTHEIKLPDHVHEINLPNHTHEIELPDHTHEIEYGIWEFDELATAIQVKIDGHEITNITEVTGERIDIAEDLYKVSDGTISRGWHKIEIIPNKLARIVSQTTVYGFIGSTEGGEF